MLLTKRTNRWAAGQPPICSWFRLRCGDYGSHVSPHSGPLPWGEGESSAVFPSIRDGGHRKRSVLSNELRHLFPLPQGGGQGERERM